MVLIESTLVGVLGVWTAATVLNSIERGSSALQRRLGPFFMLVPKWNFFSPMPGQRDYHLLYRDKRVGGSTTDWRKIPELCASPGWSRLFWNPSIYQNKAMFDISEDLNQEVQGKYVEDGDQITADEGGEELQPVDLDEIQLSVLYLAFLNLVTEQDHSDLSEATQFMIMQHSRATDGYEPKLVSQFHALE